MKESNFKTNILLKNIIGKDLITDDNLAVLELVKNSFDAGSKEVYVTFNNINTNDDCSILTKPTDHTSSIVIQDYGIGMNSDDLENKWLNIAYSEKKEKRENNGRLQAGNKGVGRFSCDRLGRMLTIYSSVDGEVFYELFIDWRKFEVEGEQDIEIQDIKLSINEIPRSDFLFFTGFQPFVHGTILVLSYLRSRWEPVKLIGLKRELEKFINPNQVFSSSSFEIKLSAPEYLPYDNSQKDDVKKINGTIQNKIFDKLDFKTTSISSSIDSSGEYITTILQDRGREVFTLVERNSFSQLQNIKVTIYYLNPYAKVFFKKQTGIRLKDFGSIYLFIDGFRVPPYGDEGDDWLGMEMRKAQGSRRYMGTREVVGRIEISNNQDKFNIISNRSGVVKNIAYQQLTRSELPYGFFYMTFRRLERFVVEGLNWDRVQDKPERDGFIEERYVIDDLNRSKQFLSVLNNIVDAKKDTFISLQINEELIQDIVDKQVSATESNFESMMKDLSSLSESLTPDMIENFRMKIGNDQSEIQALLCTLRKFDSSGSQISTIEQVQEELEIKQHELITLRLQYEESLIEKRKEEEARLKAEEELRIEQEKNTYLRTSSRSLSEDAKGLVHNIKYTSSKISSSVDNLYELIRVDKISKSELLKKLGTIKFHAKRALKISKLITRANFRSEAQTQFVDVVSYIEQYLTIYQDISTDSGMTFILNNNDVHFKKKVSILDLSVILDDLISNAEKANATMFQVDSLLSNEGQLRLIVSDNGNGISERFANFPNKIFELGVTTTDGSGIGLFNVKNALKNMGGMIFVLPNGTILKGAAFELVIK